VRRHLVVVVLLTAVWVCLWGDVTIANIVGGVAVAIGCLVAVPLDAPTGDGRLRPLAALRYVVFFAKELLVANVVVAVEVVTPGNRDNEGIVALPLAPSCSHTVMLVVVNSIGLTPGTVVVDIAEDPGTLYVHVLHLDDHDESVRRLLELERRAIAAFGSDAALAEVAELEAASRVGS
jgi:multicomponent Na+:H+ antiporter subunit E